MERAATEQNELETALARLPEMEAHVAKYRARMAPFFMLDPPARVLDIGAAQGITVLAFRRAGFDAYGVEPWAPAIEVSREIAARMDTELPIESGVAESLPFDDGSFRFAHAYSVMEHVDDPLACLREAYRVLDPGGALFFVTTSMLCPRQNEISWFVGFPWYPAPLKRAIMRWAMDHRPELVGHTTRPAVHWFRHGWVRRVLREIGFRQIVTRWDLRPAAEPRGRVSHLLIENAKRLRPVRVLGDVTQPNLEYLAIK